MRPGGFCPTRPDIEIDCDPQKHTTNVQLWRWSIDHHVSLHAMWALEAEDRPVLDDDS